MRGSRRRIVIQDRRPLITGRTKGFRLGAAAGEDPQPILVDDWREWLANNPIPLDFGGFSWPLLTLDDVALNHNIAQMADLAAERGVLHAPHVKTAMSPQLWARQRARGAWAATVAAPHQMRTVYDWGACRIVLANELADPMEAIWIGLTLARDPAAEFIVQVDSLTGVELLSTFCDTTDTGVFPAASTARNRLHVLVEFGMPGGRSGVRTTSEAVDVARALIRAGITPAGITGYEGPAATEGPTALSRDKVRLWCREFVEAARRVHAVTAGGGASFTSQHPFLVSIGGSGYLDVVLEELAPVDTSSPLGEATQVVIRSGAYVTHDHGHYAELDPWERLPGQRRLLPAITVWSEVVSVPEDGLALLGVGRRDVSFDCGLPIPLWHRDGFMTTARHAKLSPEGTLTGPTPQHPHTALRLGPAIAFAPGEAEITELNDQHAFLRGAGASGLRLGDIVGLGISHPCTTLDKWRVAVITEEDPATSDVHARDLITLDF